MQPRALDESLSATYSSFRQLLKREEGEIRLKHVNEFTDRHGKVRRYFRRPGQAAIPLGGTRLA